MTLYYSKTTGGFYDSGINGKNIPADAVEISKDTRAELMAALGRDCRIQGDDAGRPIAVAPTIDQVRFVMLQRIDDAADMARLAVVGDPLRATEYQMAEAEAKAYQAAGYTGEVPLSVASWAEAKQWTAKQAAESILAEAAAWNSALYAIRDVRLKAKEAVRNAPTAEAADAITDAAIDGINAKVKDLGNATS